MSTNVYIVEDHDVMREMLEAFVAHEPGLSVCGAAGSAEEALEGMAHCAPGLALVDVSLPAMSGIDLVRSLKNDNLNLRCLMVSGHTEQVYVQDALNAGAQGYVMKGSPARLRSAIQAVLNGEVYISDPPEEWDNDFRA